VLDVAITVTTGGARTSVAGSSAMSTRITRRRLATRLDGVDQFLGDELGGVA